MLLGKDLDLEGVGCKVEGIPTNGEAGDKATFSRLRRALNSYYKSLLMLIAIKKCGYNYTHIAQKRKLRLKETKCITYVMEELNGRVITQNVREPGCRMCPFFIRWYNGKQGIR